jgi:glycerol-3-phosphate dehydrogenase
MLAQRPGLIEFVAGSDGVLAVEIVYACTHEGARHLDDVLDRRTPIAIQSPDRGEAAMEHVLALMEETLGWSEDVVEHEREQYQTTPRAGAQRSHRGGRCRSTGAH